MPEEREQIRQWALARQRGEPAPASYDCHIVRADGSVRSVEVSASLTRYEGRAASLGILRDVTEHQVTLREQVLAASKMRLEMELAERLRTEEALRVSEERFQLAARATNDAVWDRDVETGTLAWTDAVYTLFGYAPGSVEFTIDWWDAHLHPEDRERVIATPVRALAEGEERWSREYRFLRSNGTYAHILDRGLIVRAADGTATRMTGSVQDVSARVEAEAALFAANSELQQFAYTVSHDLKAPLVSIQGYATRLKDEHGDALAQQGDGAGARYLDRISANADRLSALITDVLEYSRLERVDGFAENVSLAQLVTEATGTLQLQLERSGGSVEVLTALPVVHGIPVTLRQIVGNLIENAIKYGGSPVGASPVVAPVVSVGADELATQWRVWVRDNGPGILPEYHEQVFRLFSRLPDGKRRDPNGTGVGLATVKRAALHLGGNLWIESNPADPSRPPGTTFFVTLPKAKQSRDHTEPKEAGTIHILLAEDNEDHAFLTTAALKDAQRDS